VEFDFGFGSEQIQSYFDDVSLDLDVETPKSFQQLCELCFYEDV